VEQKNKKVGAAWVNETADGKKYLSIVIEVDGKDLQFVAFKNTYKNVGDAKPDYNILEKSAPSKSAKPTEEPENLPF
jgi:hypothetical protein